MHDIKLNKSYYYIALLLFVAVAFTLLMPQLRQATGQDHILGLETYYHLNNQGESVQFYDRALTFIIDTIGEKTTLYLLPALLILGSLLLFSNIIKYLLETDAEYFFALLLLLLTPAFLNAHLGLSVVSMVLFFFLLTIYLYLRNSYFYLVSLALFYLFDPFLALAFTVILFVRELQQKEYTNVFILFFALLILLSTSFSTNIHTQILNQDLLSFSINPLFDFFSAEYGFTLFLLSLGILGLLRLRKEDSFALFVATLLLLLSLFYQPARLLGIVVLVVYSAKSANFLLERKWEIPYLGQLVLLLFLCMLIFSTTIFIQAELQQAPQEETLQDLAFIHDLPLTKQAKILTMPSEAEYTTYYTNRSVLASIYRYDDSDEKALELYSSRQFRYIKEEFQKENIALVIVDKKVANYLQRPDEGLLFVMKNNDHFKRIYQSKTMNVYYFDLWNEKE